MWLVMDLVLFPEEQVSIGVIRFGAAGNAQELLALHNEMRQSTGRYSEPLRQAIRAIARRDATTHD